jgi:hypothetical protein
MPSLDMIPSKTGQGKPSPKNDAEKLFAKPVKLRQKLPKR